MQSQFLITIKGKAAKQSLARFQLDSGDASRTIGGGSSENDRRPW